MDVSGKKNLGRHDYINQVTKTSPNLKTHTQINLFLFIILVFYNCANV